MSAVASPSINPGFKRWRHRLTQAFGCLLVLAGVVWMTGNSLHHVILFNANIITMDAAGTTASAVSLRNGVIELLGSDEQIKSTATWYTSLRDMRGKTILPGFVDAHSHFPSSGVTEVTLDLSSPPLGTIQNLDQLYAAVETAVNGLDPGRWLIGFNYDQASLQEGRHPNRAELDRISRHHPVYLYHSSGHMGVANTQALQQLEIPDAGLNSSGLLVEKAAPSLSRLLSELGLSELVRVFFSARDEYLRHGVTTVVNGATDPSLHRLLYGMSLTPLMPLRAVVSPRWDAGGPFDKPGSLAQRSRAEPDAFGFFSNRKFFIGPVKITVDGSPQGYTAWLQEPYSRIPPGLAPDYRGVPLFGQKALEQALRDLARQGLQVAMHGNGDAAIERILLAVESLGLDEAADQRPILVHAQTATHDQVKRMKQLGVVPTFFPAHVFYWGDWHSTQTLGPERAQNISPTGWAVEESLRFTIHSDAPVTPMRPLQLAQQAVQRITGSGRLLGPRQRLSMSQALRALTIDAAWQHFLDAGLGSIEVGKWADLVVLSHDPLLSDDTQGISVLETLVAGRTVYSATE